MKLNFLLGEAEYSSAWKKKKKKKKHLRLDSHSRSVFERGKNVNDRDVNKIEEF